MKFKRGIVALLLICCFQNLIVYAAEEQQPAEEPVVQESEANESAVQQLKVEVSTKDLTVFVDGNGEFYIVSEGIEPDSNLHVYSQDEEIADVCGIEKKDVQNQELIAGSPEEAGWYSVVGIGEGTTQICVEAEGILEKINVTVLKNDEEDNAANGEDIETDEDDNSDGEVNSNDEVNNDAGNIPIISENEGEAEEQGSDEEVLPEVLTVGETQTRSVSRGWVTEGDNTYYFDNIGVKCTGIVEIDDILYYFDESTGALFKKGGWINQGSKTYFCNTDGRLYRNQFIKFGDISYYYMGSDGSLVKGNFTLGDKTYHANSGTGEVKMQAGWIEDGGKKYFSAADGVLYISQFIKFGDIYYYMGSDGSVTKGNFTIGNKTYHANSSTGELRLVAGWIEDGGKKYYSNSEGVLYINEFVIMDSGNTYYLGKDGSLQKGVIEASDGNLYYSDPSTGVVNKKSGWITGKDGKKYFSDATGKLYRNQLISFGSSVYYMGNDGSAQKGSVKIGSELYFFDQNGLRKNTAGWAEYNGKKYYVNGNGTLYHDMFITFGSSVAYYMGSDGSVQKGVVSASNGNVYYTDPNTGLLQKKTGWIDFDGKRYFSDATGKLYKNQFISFGSSVLYYMGSDGSVQKGIVKASDGNIYYTDPSTGLLQKKAGWIDSGGKRYFSDAAGKLYKNQFISFGSTVYYMGSDGSVQKGPVKVGNNWYFLDKNGVRKSSAGWAEYNDKKYYVNGSGTLYHDMFISFGSSTVYYMGSDASMQKGIVNVKGVLYYANPGTGLIKKNSGWIDYNSKRYFADANGVLYKNQLISFGSDVYYMGSDGSVQKGNHYVNGRWYYFDEKTGIMKRAQGWFTAGSGKYYQKADGNLAKGYMDIDGSRYYFNSSGMLASKKGIDVSQYQGNIDWNKVKNDGVEFAIIRVGYRGYSNGKLVEDPKFKQNIQGAAAAGIPVGVYFFSQAVNVAEAREEANFVYNLIKNYKITYPVVFDAEFSAGNPNGRADKLSKSTRTLVVNTFCSELKNKGYTPMLYTGIYFLRDNLEASLLSGYQLWLARYNSTLGYNGSYRCWQYSDAGKVNGISGNVDMNVWLN